jgi:hypothetical protein
MMRLLKIFRSKWAPFTLLHALSCLTSPRGLPPLSTSVPIFAGTSLLFFFSLYVGLPYLLQKGVSWFSIYNLVLALPMFVDKGCRLPADG